MSLHRPSELHSFLVSLGRKAKKSLSQNFLVDGNVVHNMLSCIAIKPPATVIEIGPGPGVMTEALCGNGFTVVAIEIDHDFAGVLSRLASPPSLTVIAADALQMCLSSLTTQPDSTVLLSNIPYHLTSSFLSFMCDQKDAFCQAVVMMQKEVAQKIEEKKTFLSLMLHLVFHVRTAHIVSRNSFSPKPKVDSSIVVFNKKPALPYSKSHIEWMLSVAKTCFMFRRKSIQTSLKTMFGIEKIQHELARVNIPATARPEELTHEQWKSLLLDGSLETGKK